MEWLPPRALLEATHAFPGTYWFKVIGRVDDGFIARVVAAVRETLVSEADPPYYIRCTAGGRHVAITLSPSVTTADQVLAVYRRLKGLAGLVVMF